jgi:hypothetical protein
MALLLLPVGLVETSHAGTDLLGNPVAEPGPFPSAVSRMTIDRSDFGPGAINLNFDELDGGDIWYLYCDGDTITDQYENVIFEVPGTTCSICANSYLGGDIPNNSGPNVAFVQQNFCDPEALFAQATFALPVRRVGTDFWTTYDADFTMTIYDASDTVIEEVTVVGDDIGTWWSGFLGLDAGSAIIARVEFRSAPTNVPYRPFNSSVDDFIYEGPGAISVQPDRWGEMRARYR